MLSQRNIFIVPVAASNLRAILQQTLVQDFHSAWVNKDLVL